MKVYLKGAVVVAVIIGAAVLYWVKNADKLTVNLNPESYNLITRLEKEGAIDFTASRLDGTTVKLSDYKGKVVILNFWASWCNPCVQEFPSLIQLAEHFKGEVVILALSNDENKADVEAFIKAFGFPKVHIEILLDSQREIAKQYGVEKIPESFLFNREQKLVRKVLGIDNWYSEGAIGFFNELLGKASEGK